MNILRNKKIVENWNHREVLTNGDVINYTGMKGFASTSWPETLTYDLEAKISIKCIRFLLWDNLGSNRTVRSNRKYRYRLLTSIDGINWNVHFDTGKEGYNGWQEFIFDNFIETRFIRIHAIHNSANSEFHIVEIQAFENEPEPVIGEIILNQHFAENDNETESGDGLPITNKIKDIASRLKNMVEQNKMLNPDSFNKIIDDLMVQAKDIKIIEGNIDSIKRAILDPVEIELKKSSQIAKFSIWGFVVGLIGIVVPIVILIINNL